MNNITQKLPFQISLGLIAQGGANDAISKLGMSLPASIVSVNGSIATVKFEVLSEYNLPQIQVPVVGSQYVREPLQSGDMGILIPCDANIDAVSGMGDKQADLSSQGNLSALSFLPLGNKTWKAVDPNMLVLTGVSDVMIRDNTHQLQLENEYASWVSLISQINALLLVIGPLLTSPQILTPITTNTNPVVARV